LRLRANRQQRAESYDKEEKVMTESGTFQVSINGFDVGKQTWDDELNTDGWADEVFLAAEVTAVEDGKAMYTNRTQSRVMGDINGFPDRIQAGAAIHWPFGQRTGGLVSGDHFPTDEPYERKAPLSPIAPPMLVWQGRLTKDSTAVAITPSVWEWDQNGGTTLLDWLAWQADIADTYGERIKGNLPKPYQIWIDWTVLGLDTLQRTAKDGVFGKPVTRPIGMSEDGTDMVWKPQTLALTYDTANYIIASQPAGKGFGILSFVYTDQGIGDGSYTLYVQVERLDTPGGWTDVGHANRVTGLSYAAGELWCSADNRLWHRAAIDTEVNWSAVSEANYVHGMAGEGSKLWCANGNNLLWVRPAVAQPMHWTAVSEANYVTAMAFAGGKLWCVAQGQLWHREPVEIAQHWVSVGSVGGITGMAGAGDRLYATTDGNLLLSRAADPAAANTWTSVRSNVPPDVVAMASDGQRKLWVATSTNRLLQTSVA
jgi:hypothetical protein